MDYIKKNIAQSKVALRYVLTMILLLQVNSLFAAQVNYNVDNENIALHGFDSVSYFHGQPIQGKSALTYKYKNINYIFSNEKNMKIFMSDPEKYIPVFGGYCAYGVRVGKKFDIDPTVYAIEEGKLYLLLDRSTKNLWNKDRKRNIAIAERLWPTIKSVSPSTLNN
jgi:YHS domain-containing protein